MTVPVDCQLCEAPCCERFRVFRSNDAREKLDEWTHADLRRYRAATAKWRASWSEEGRIVVDMLIPNRGDAPYFHCRHFDRSTRLCQAYDDRPSMCREYPLDGRCGFLDVEIIR